MEKVTTLLDAVLAHGASRPHAPALHFGEGPALSYFELGRAIAAQSAALHESGATFGSRLVFDARRDEQYVINWLACTWIGASFVPVATGLPEALDARLLSGLGEVLDLRKSQPCGPRDRPAPPRASVTPGDEVYVMHTSGSSGTPKGVAIPHRGLPHLFEHQAKLFGVTEESRTSWLLAPHFDASISDIGVPLWRGAQLFIRPEDGPRPSSPFDFMERHALTHVDLPPAQLPGLLARGLPGTLETLVVGGEPASPAALREAAQSVRIVNVYGPTETTVCASAEVVDPSAPRPRPNLGRPLKGVQFHVAPRKDEVGGELWISGWGVALGYVGDDESSGAFGEFPGDGAAVRAYGTGDLVVEEPDGTFGFLGRVDRQVQLRGQRLDLTEVEAAFASIPGVRAAAAVRLEAPAPRVAVFFAAVEDHVEIPVARDASRQLEDWKRPAVVVQLPELPRLSNHKVDLAALRRLGHSRPAEGAPEEPQDPLAKAWCQVLGTGSARDEDRFASLGGDSITALELSVEAARLGIAVEPEAALAAGTLGELRRHMERGAPTEELQARAEEALRLGRGPLDSPSISGSALLLTGATGMLGTAILRHVEVQRGGREVIAVVRAQSDLAGRRRLETIVARPLPRTVEVWRGDVTQRHFGLNEARVQELRERVGHVIQGAGVVDLTRGYDSLSSVHVAGALHGVSLARAIGARLHHASTLSIFVEGQYPDKVIHEASNAADVGRVFGGYAQSKWVGDAVVRASGVEGSVVRLGLLTQAPAPAPGPGLPLDQLSRVIRGIAHLGLWPGSADEGRFDVTPVSRAADLFMDISGVQGLYLGAAEPLHLANSVSATGAELRRAMEIHGIRLREAGPWPPQVPSSTGAARGDVAVALAALTARAGSLGERPLPRSGDLFLASDYSFDCSATLARFPRAAPKPPTAALLQKLVGRAMGTATAWGHP